MTGSSSAQLIVVRLVVGRCQRFGERGRASECEQVGWVGAVGKLCVEGVEPEQLSIQKSRSAAMRPATSASVATIGCLPMLASWGLLLSQRCAKWSNPDVAPLTGEGDGDRIHRAFHDHRDSAAGELVVEGAEQLRALVEQRSVAGVDVFRSGQVDIAEVGTPSTNESENLAVVDDREDDLVPEAVDQPAGACGDNHTGNQHFFVGDPVPPKVVDKVGPACGCLTGLESVVAGQLLTEPVGQIVLPPRGREAVSEVGEAELVDLDHAVLADRAFSPGHRSGEHPSDVGVGLLGGPGNIAKHRGDREVWFDVAFAAHWLTGCGYGGRPGRGSSVGWGS